MLDYWAATSIPDYIKCSSDKTVTVNTGLISAGGFNFFIEHHISSAHNEFSYFFTYSPFFSHSICIKANLKSNQIKFIYTPHISIRFRGVYSTKQ